MTANTKKSRARCPICSRPALKDHMPFCSQRCRNEDLSNWLGGKYTVPVIESEPDELVAALEDDEQLH